MAAWAPAAILLITSMVATVRAYMLAFWPSYLIFAPLVHEGVRLLRHGWLCGQADFTELNIAFLPIFQAPWVLVGLGIGALALATLAIRIWIANELGLKLALKAVAIGLPLAIGAALCLYSSALSQAQDVSYDCFGGVHHAQLPLQHLYGPFYW